MSNRKVYPTMKVRWLSERVRAGIPFAAASLRRHITKDTAVRFSTTSRCTVLVVAQTKRQMYALVFLPCGSLIVKLPLWSTPTFVNGATHRTRSAGKGGGSGRGNVLPLTLWQGTHLRRRLLKSERILGVQQRCLYRDSVCDRPI